MDDFERELKTCFLDEATQHLEDCEKCFLDLDRERASPEVIEKIFRLAHNLKGAARSVGFGHIAEFTHELESLLQKFRSGEMQVTKETVNLLLECNDFLRMAIGALRRDFDAKIEHTELLEKIKSHNSSHLVAQSLEAPEVVLPVTIVVPVPEPVQEPVVEPAPTPATAPKRAVNSHQEESIRVSLSRLERLNNFAGELVILQAMLDQHAGQINSPKILKTISQLNKITKEIQNISTACRMVPLKQTFQKLQRVARDTSITLDKLVDLELDGEDIEVDKTVIEHLSDPLMHIIRNAVDHGLENKAERLKAGKSERGTIRLRAYHKGSHLVCEITDDGRGLDEGVILKRAISLGLVDESAKLGSADIHELIFRPGFSTKTEASEISGRGVGLDVVKKSIERLAGDIWMESEKGKGTLFRIHFPLTLAITDGMVVMAGKQRFVVLLSQIFETVRPDARQLNTVTGKGTVLNLRDETIPLFHLSELLRLKGPPTPVADGLALIVKDKKQRFAVLVDEIVRQQQVVMKQIGLDIRNQRGFLGTAILGDGQPSLILDLQDLTSSSINTANTRSSMEAS